MLACKNQIKFNRQNDQLSILLISGNLHKAENKKTLKNEQANPIPRNALYGNQ
ncbi:MAG: hypothetical protein KAR42_09095 [candidate division Zixibacteria bacterium]|nr:hypothetical protein [candidate division Zixibacteria bacterium]